MAMTAGAFRVSTGLTLRGTFPPQGVVSSSDPLNSVQIPQLARASLNLAFGTASGQGDIFICQDRTLAATTAATYDLYTGTDLKDLIGATAALRKVKYVGVYVIADGDASGIRIGGAASQAWPAFFADASDKALIFPDGPPYQGGSLAGVAVGAMTNNWKVENLGAVDVTLRYVIIGTSV